MKKRISKSKINKKKVSSGTKAGTTGPRRIPRFQAKALGLRVTDNSPSIPWSRCEAQYLQREWQTTLAIDNEIFHVVVLETLRFDKHKWPEVPLVAARGAVGEGLAS